MVAPADMELGLGSALGNEPSAEPDAAGDDGDDVLSEAELSAADDVMQAAQEGNVKAFRDALKAFVQLCYSEE